MIASAGESTQTTMATAPHTSTKTWKTAPATMSTSRSMAPIMRENELDMNVLKISPNCTMLG